jgi:hypothetical protein
MKLPRFTVRRLMVAVAIVGIILWGFRLRTLSAHYRAEVERCEVHIRLTGAMCFFDNPKSSPEMNKRRLEAQWDWINRYGAHYYKLKCKYECAASYPWLSVETDPPEPDWPQ